MSRNGRQATPSTRYWLSECEARLNKMIIIKFGGTSVGSAERIRNTSDIIKKNLNKNPVIVVSAVSKVTDLLIKLADESANGSGNELQQQIKDIHLEIIEKLNLGKNLLEEDFNNLAVLSDETKSRKIINQKILDHFQSFGEQMSSKIVAAHLSSISIESRAFNSWELGFLTNDDFGNAEPLESCHENLRSEIKKLNCVPVITGYIGKTENGEATTLGRGGSDYSAAIIGAAADAEEIQIWTDVDGMMSTDPKIAANAKTIERVSFAEASELAYFGARVLHPKTILPAMRKNIPVRILNSFHPENEGTTIVNDSEKSEQAVKAIACKSNTTLIHIDSKRMLGAYGFLARIFEIFSKYKKSVDVISTSEVSVSLTVDNGESVQDILNDLKEISDVEILKDKSIICVVGEGMRNTLGVPGRIFTTLSKNNVHVEMISMGASEINITFIVDGKDTEKAVRVLHKEYFG